MAAIVEEGNCGTGATCLPRPGLFVCHIFVPVFVFCLCLFVFMIDMLAMSRLLVFISENTGGGIFIISNWLLIPGDLWPAGIP